jgi:fructoselysine-6-P-deglycase FrlB-like protein
MSSHEHTAGAFMEEELLSQPDCWQQVLGLADQYELLRRPGQRVAIIGCGTSWFVAQAMATLRESAGLGVSDAFAASEAPLPTRDYDAVIAISRSGTTTEVADLLRGVAEGVTTVAIVAEADSPIGALADEVIELPFADERSVVQTRFASTVIALALAATGHPLDEAIADARAVLADPAPAVLVDAEQLTCLGTGWTVGLAHEAALKMREASQSWTESYPAMEYRHGPMSIATPGRAVWVFGDAPASLQGEVAATGAAFVPSQTHPLAELARAHQVALERSRARGLDADAPRHLTRSVILAS